MPPKAVRTIRDLIFWQYAKIISESAGIGKKQFGFIMDRFQKLSSGQISWSTSVRSRVWKAKKAHGGKLYFREILFAFAVFAKVRF